MTEFKEDDPLPEKLQLLLSRCEGETPNGLEQSLADFINSTMQQAELPTPVEEEFQPEVERPERSMKIEAQLFHRIDEIATENPQRVQAREQLTPEEVDQRVIDAEDNLRQLLLELAAKGYHIRAKVVDPVDA